MTPGEVSDSGDYVPDRRAGTRGYVDGALMVAIKDCYQRTGGIRDVHKVACCDSVAAEGGLTLQ